MASGLNQKVATPKIFGITADTVTALATAVDTKVNTLNTQLNNPSVNATTGQANTPGAVDAGSIVVSDMRVTINGNTPVYYCTVHWIELIAPTFS